MALVIYLRKFPGELLKWNQLRVDLIFVLPHGQKLVFRNFNPGRCIQAKGFRCNNDGVGCFPATYHFPLSAMAGVVTTPGKPQAQVVDTFLVNLVLDGKRVATVIEGESNGNNTVRVTNE